VCQRAQPAVLHRRVAYLLACLGALLAYPGALRDALHAVTYRQAGSMFAVLQPAVLHRQAAYLLACLGALLAYPGALHDALRAAAYRQAVSMFAVLRRAECRAVRDALPGDPADRRQAALRSAE
jgi:hypothetical protein